MAKKVFARCLVTCCACSGAIAPRWSRAACSFCARMFPVRVRSSCLILHGCFLSNAAVDSIGQLLLDTDVGTSFDILKVCQKSTFLEISSQNTIARMHRRSFEPLSRRVQVDTDGNDCDMIAEILRCGYLPKIIHMEIAPNFPPPLLFNWHQASAGCGCCSRRSLSAGLVALLAHARARRCLHCHVQPVACVGPVAAFRIFAFAGARQCRWSACSFRFICCCV